MVVKRVAAGVAGMALTFLVASTASAQTLQSATDVLNVREGPGLNYSVTGKLMPGETAKVLAQQGDWYRVASPGGGYAWVHAYYTVQWYEDENAYIRISAREGASLLRDPDAAAPEVTTLYAGTARYRLHRSLGPWYEVSLPSGRRGWLNSASIQIDRGQGWQDPPPPPTVPAGEPPVPKLPPPPATNPTPPTTPPPVTPPPVTPPPVTPPPVTPPPSTLPPPPPAPPLAALLLAPAPPPTDPAMRPFLVSVDRRLNVATATAVREGRSSDYKALTTVPAGESLQYLDSAEGWLKVRTNGGVGGWIDGRAVKAWDMVDYKSSVNYRVVEGDWAILEPAIGRATDNNINLRSGPTLTSKVVGQLNLNDLFKEWGAAGGFWQVTTAGGQAGYVSQDWSAQVHVPEISAVTLKYTGANVLRLEVSGGGPAELISFPQSQGLALKLKAPNTRPGRLDIGAHLVQSLHVSTQGVLLQFEATPAYTVLQNDAQKVVLELRPQVRTATLRKAADREVYSFAIAGEVVPTAARSGGRLSVQLPGALLAAGATPPPGLTIQPGSSGVTLGFSDSRPATLKVYKNRLDVVFYQPGLKGKVIVIDPGHGGFDPGASGYGLQEKNVNLNIARTVRDYLVQMGATVYLTRTDDNPVADADTLAQNPTLSERQRVELAARTTFAARADADLFLSIHANSTGSASTSGTEVYYYAGGMNQEDSARLARTVLNAVVAAAGLPNRGVRQQDFYVVKFTEAPSALLETAYLSNAADAGKLAQAEFRLRVARAIADGIAAYWA